MHAAIGCRKEHVDDINAGFPGSGTAKLPYAAQFGRTIPTNMWDGYLSSNYHSLQVAVNRAFSPGVERKTIPESCAVSSTVLAR